MPIQFGGVRHLYGTSGADIMRGHNLYDDIFHGSAGADQMYGYGGHDTVDYSSSTSRVTISLNLGRGWGGDAADDAYFGIENAIGSSDGDIIYGNAAENRLEGRDGEDTIYGYDGADTILGGDGDDTLSGDEGADELYGGLGDDHLRADLQDSVLDGGTGVDLLSFYDEISITVTMGAGGSGTATGQGGSVDFVRIESIGGSKGDDTITGNGQDNVLQGHTGNDTLVGGGGNDVLIGGDYKPGNRPERDTLDGGRGNDTLTGGTDADTFIFDASEDDDDHDIITDFEVGLDKIDLSQTERFDNEDFDELLDDADQIGADVVIDMGDGTLTLQGIDIDDLSAGDFIF